MYLRKHNINSSHICFDADDFKHNNATTLEQQIWWAVALHHPDWPSEQWITLHNDDGTIVGRTHYNDGRVIFERV